MSDLKCPFCGKKLVDRGYYDFMCPDECDGAGNIVGNESMWQELITTRKALDDLQKDYDLAIQNAKTWARACAKYKSALDVADDALIGIEDGVDNLYIAQVTAEDAMNEIHKIIHGGKDG